jgi:hypothetical protein
MRSAGRLAHLDPRAWFGLIALAALLERLGLFLNYRPVAYNDTGSYRRLAEAILAGWDRYDGTRVPGYPIFLGLFGADRSVYLAQLLLGLLTTLVLFYIGWLVSRKAWFGALAALAHTLSLQQLFFEADLLSETLTTFLIVLFMAGMAWLLEKGERPLWQVLLAAALTGLAGGMAALTRPLFVFLPAWAAVCLLVFRWSQPRIRWGAALAAGLVGLGLVGVWMDYLHRHLHRFALTTMTGYHLVQHTGVFFEYVPDEHAAIRDTYIQYRDQRIAETGSPGNAIWDAIPALQQVSGLSFFDLSDLLARISVRLILEHPLLYLKGAAQGWIWFWKAPVYWSAEALGPAWLAGPLKILILIDRGLLVAANLALVGVSPALAWKRPRGRLGMGPWLWFCFTSIWLTSAAQALLDHGDNPRFLVPVQSLVVLVVLWWGLRTLSTRRKNDEDSAA